MEGIKGIYIRLRSSPLLHPFTFCARPTGTERSWCRDLFVRAARGGGEAFRVARRGDRGEGFAPGTARRGGFAFGSQ